MIKKLMMFVATMAAMGAWAATETVNGIEWTYQVSHGKAEIRNGYSAKGAITIPSTLGGYTVTSIGDQAFSFCSGLTSVTIPDGVTSIGEGAFYGCSGLTSVTMPDSMTSIGDRAFFWCGLTSVTIPNGVTSIGWSAFKDCIWLTSVTIGNGVTSIGSYAFYGCYELTSVTIGNSVTSIGERAFYGCSGLTSLTIPDSVTSIGERAFEDCIWLTSVTIGNGVTSIGERAFALCSGLMSVTIGNSVTNIGYDAFFYSRPTSVTIPQYVCSVGFNSVFPNCTSVKNITISDGVTNIGSYAFSRCSGLKSVTIPDSVTSIGFSAFRWCDCLVYAKVPLALKGQVESGEVFVDCSLDLRIKYYVGYTITFNPNGGAVSPEAMTVEYGEAIGTLPTPTRWRYMFLGWYTAPEGGTKISVTTKVASDVTYYAHWVYDGSATVTLAVAIGCEAKGSVSGGKTAKAGTKMTLKATANKGYVFSHWEGPLGDAMDPCSPSITYTVGNEDAQFTAHFIPLADDAAAISFNMNDEYAAGAPIVPVAVDASGCTSLPTVKVAGLPAGLKFTAKDIFKTGSKTEVEYPANTIYGTPTKSGVYTIVATVTTAGKKTATCSQTVIVRKSGEKVVVAECDATGGKVTGGGVYLAGKKVTLKATANKGYVFAGWYEDEAFTTPCDSTVVDYRTISYSYTMGNEDKTFYARFIPVAADALLDLTVDGENVPTTFTVSKYAQLSLDVDSLSLPKISVKGLPAGMKFTAKPIYKKGLKTEIEVPANTIYGAPTKPGNTEIQVSLSNQSIKKEIVKKFIIEVPNITGANGCFANDLDNGVGKKCILSVGITNIDDLLPNLKLKSNIAKLAVSGLPSGLKYDAKRGKIIGIATKVGTYTVTLTVADGKAKYISTITIEVEALPDWVVGTFRGSVITEGRGSSDICSFEVKVTSQGGVSAKLIEPNPAWGSGSLKTYSLIKLSDSEYTFGIWDGDIENWEECSIGDVYISKGDKGLGVLYAEEYGIDEDEDEFYAYWEGYQDAYFLSSSVIPKPVFKTDKNLYYNIDPDDLDEDDGVYLTFGNNGLVTISPRVGDIWGKSQLLPIEYDSYSNVVIASLWLMGYDEWEDCTFGAELILSIPVTQDGTAKASEIIIEDVFPGPNW